MSKLHSKDKLELMLIIFAGILHRVKDKINILLGNQRVMLL